MRTETLLVAMKSNARMNPKRPAPFAISTLYYIFSIYKSDESRLTHTTVAGGSTAEVRFVSFLNGHASVVVVGG